MFTSSTTKRNYIRKRCQKEAGRLGSKVSPNEAIAIGEV
jgi:hypothetical protein